MAAAFGYVPFQTLVPVVLLGLVAAVAVATPALLRHDPRAALLRVTRVLLVGALLAILAVTLSGGGGTGVNLIPGAGIRAELDNANRDLGLLNLAGNVLMFVPVGFLIPLATRSGFRRALAACVVISVAVELFQLTLARSFDVDDVFLNAFGGALGAAVAVAGAILWRRARVAAPETLLGEGPQG
ncbi:MAG TPA: VanZ family protein [Spirillospora sp.]|jgi:glycopeptide antibiotics resistance protein|nr:VanZ family protein [Spirillospora sp.]